MDYRDTLFKPKPKCIKSEQCLDMPCSLDRFTCSRKWWEREVKTVIDNIEKEFDMAVTIDIDNYDDNEAIIRVDGRYVFTAANKEEISVALKVIYNMLLMNKA